MLAPGGPAKPLVGLVGLLNRSGAPLPSIFHCYLVSRCADLVAWDSSSHATWPVLRLLGRCSGTLGEPCEWAVCFGWSQVRRGW